MSFLNAQKIGSSILKALGAAVLLSTLAGCALGNIELSGPPNQPNVTATANIHGKAIGGQNPLTYSTIDLYTVNNTAYGGASNLLTTVLSGTNQYYPGGTTGCNNTALSPTAYAIVSGTVTITGANTMIAGQLINVSDSGGSGLNGTYAVNSANATSFTVTAALSDGVGVTGGTYTPICYTHPTTDKNGNFNVSGDYTCSGSSILYIQGSGGNPGLATGTNNSSIVITALLQASPTSNVALTCASGSLSSTNVTINELTTAAMGIAMGQFFTTTYGGAPTADGFGAPSTNLTGITNAANTALELVSSWTGTANTSYTLTSGSFSITATPESLKMQTIGDILASCVNGSTANTNCTAIFGALQLNGGVTPTDTLQAAVLFGINPTAGTTVNSTTLWNHVAGTSQPWTALSAQPADWSIGIQYIDTNPSCTTGTGETCALNEPQEVAIDSSGNVWVLNTQSAAAASMTELSPGGTPLVNITNAGGSFTSLNPRNIAIDTNNNLWFGSTSGTSHVYEYNTTTSTGAQLSPNSGPYALAIDGSNNVFYGFESTSATASVGEFTNDTLATNNLVEYGTFCNSGSTTYTACATNTWMGQGEYAAVDTSGNVWFTNGSATTQNSEEATVWELTGFNPGTACTAVTGPCISTTTGDTSLTWTYTRSSGTPAFSTPFGIAAGPGGVMWIANGASGATTVVALTSLTAGTAYGTNTSFNQPTFLAVDGVGNVWVTNKAGGGSVSELQGVTNGSVTMGTVLSPTKGAAPFNTVGFVHSGIASPGGIAIDPSGNVWVANPVVTTGGVSEMVGVGAPTTTPIAKALNLGKVGVRP